MSEHVIHVIIEGEPFLSRARAYRKETFRVEKEWRAFAKAQGAEGLFGTWQLFGLKFKQGKVPSGWTRPNRRGCSTPKIKSEARTAMLALPKMPSSCDVFGDALIYDCNWKVDDENWGYGAIGFFFNGPSIGWVKNGETFIASIPDAFAAAQDCLKAHPNAVITNGADKWTLPDGLRRITKAEMELIYAQAKVDAEREAREKV